jgi:Ser/Thr protein kinase RdoA (MazF antagonist)
MTLLDPAAAARQVLAALGIGQADLAPLGSGLASEAWRVDQGGPWLALRIASGAPSSYEMEHALMDRLAASGARVPRPLRGSWQVEGWKGSPFSLTTGLEGSPLAEADQHRAAPALAEFLHLLHELEVDGYGPLGVDDGRLQGRQSSMAAGISAWARRPLWPLGNAKLDLHPALASRAALRARLEERAPEVRRALSSGPAVVLHSDLHEENILDKAGALGIIDFGEALIGPAAWEFAAIAYFLGWSTSDATLVAYARDDSERDRLRSDATAIGLAFGVHRWVQDREREIDEDAYDEAFLVETLSRM